MPVNISVTTRRDPRDRNAKPKYHATVRSKGRIKAGTIANDISTMAAINSLDAAAVLEAFTSVVPDRLAEGHIVELKGFGTFRLSVSSRGARDPRDVTAQDIKDVRILFRPQKSLLEQLSSTVFERVQDE